jgi:hypothetical protein
VIRSFRGIAPRIAASALVTPAARVAAHAAAWRAYAAGFKATARPVPLP